MRKLYYAVCLFILPAAACKKESNTPTATNQDKMSATGDYRMVSFGGKSGIDEFGTFVRLNWSAENENKMHHYVVERATAGDNWHVLHEMPCSRRNSTIYSMYKDGALTTREGDEFRYRVTAFDDKNGKISSTPVKIRFK